MRVPDRLARVDRLLAIVLAITALALLLRLPALGLRIAHWDEARVGYGILRYMATGAWHYRPIVHGPFLVHVNRVVFATLGANDATMRLVVAVVGGLLPLSAWLYREHLGRVEVAALALLLAVDPILVYHSRFMRNDVLVAAFAFAALGCYVRLYDTRRHRYLYAGTFLLALAFTTKENAILYPVTILGGVALLLDQRLFLARGTGEAWTGVLRRHVAGAARGLWSLRLPIAVAVVEFAAIFVFFYAPREASVGGLGLWHALAHPRELPDLLAAATYNPAPCTVPGGGTPARYCAGALEQAYDSWFTGGLSDHAYLPYLGVYAKVLVFASGGLVLLSIVGFLADRYGGERPRDLVALGFYWGLASVLGYPIVMTTKGGWYVTHAVVPLAIPAAAGVGLFYRWGWEAMDHDDRVSAALAAIVLIVLVGQLPVAAVQTSYLHPQDPSNVMVQYAQPEGQMRPALAAIHRAARDHQGTDVVWYGSHFYVADESSADRLPAGGNWYNRLPMPWYLERDNATVASTENATALADMVATEHPPVVLTTESGATDVADAMTGYRRFQYAFRQPSGGPPEQIVIFVDERYAG